VKKPFDPTIAGIQIDWSEDQEIEYLGPAVLSGKASCTAATCVRGSKRIHYVYPVDEQLLAPNRLIISYHRNPIAWRSSWGWQVYEGDLIINFRATELMVPEAISFRYEDSGESEDLVEGIDWIYVSPTQVCVPPITVRGRLVTSRLARPHQQRLRCLLLSEYGSCQITGVATAAALEACHIVPVQNGGMDNTANALLLRRDLHAMFDAGLIEFQLSGNQWRLHCAPAVRDRQYLRLEGAALTGAGLPSHTYLQARQALAASG